MTPEPRDPAMCEDRALLGARSDLLNVLRDRARSLLPRPVFNYPRLCEGVERLAKREAERHVERIDLGSCPSMPPLLNAFGTGTRRFWLTDEHSRLLPTWFEIHDAHARAIVAGCAPDSCMSI